MPKLSLVIPVYDMQDRDFFLNRCLASIDLQTFKDFELVITENGKGMAGNTNEGIKKAKGEIIKILFMDDYLAHPQALQDIVDNFKSGWLVTACEHDDRTSISNKHIARFTKEIYEGKNTIGSPSVLAFENNKPLLFDEDLTWMLDIELYIRLHERYGKPTVLDETNVIIGIGPQQATSYLPDEIKQKEFNYVTKNYDKRS